VSCSVASDESSSVVLKKTRRSIIIPLSPITGDFGDMERSLATLYADDVGLEDSGQVGQII